jgi:mono/diheme cytochrome c family protein
MHIHRRSLFAALLMAAGVAATPSVMNAQEGSLAEGARTYGRVCGSCHNARSPLERSDRDWVTIINHMRVRGNMTGAQARNVLAFLQGTNEDPTTITVLPAPPRISDGLPLDTIQQGKRIVAEKACLGCHVVGDEGGNIGPTLNGVIARRGMEYVHDKLADPTFDVDSSMMPNFGLTDEEIGWVVAYLATLDD